MLKNIFNPFTVLTLAIIILSPTKSFSQNEMILYNIQSIPQSNGMNPAIIPDCKKSSGLLISSFTLNYFNTSFAINDLVKPRANQSQYIDFDNVYSKLSDNNLLRTRQQLEYFFYGEKFKQHYFNLTLTTKSFLYSDFSKNFAQFAIYGNSSFLNETKQVGHFWTNFTVYQELATGITFRINDKINIGLRPKFLMGITNISCDKTDIELFTDSLDYNTRMKADLLINSSGFDLFPTSNNGFACDLGMLYDINRHLSVSFSILDVGYIHWSQVVENFATKDFTNKEFSGLTFKEIISGKNDKLEMVIDTITDAFGITRTKNAYNSNLIYRCYLSGKYRFTAFDDISLLIRGEWINEKIIPSYSVAYNKYFSKMLSLSANYSIFEKSYFNIGLGGSLNLGNLQLYLASDNVPEMISFKKAKNYSLRMGLIFTFGREARVNFAAPIVVPPEQPIEK